VKTLIALFSLLAAAATASAQEFRPAAFDPEVEFRFGPKEPTPGGWEGSLDLYFRYSMLQGNDGAGGKWSDDFHDGLGFRVDGTVELHLSAAWSLGAFLSTGVDVFSGKNSGGVALDDWVIFPVLVGPVVKTALGPQLYAEGHAGVGFVRYPAIDAKGFGVSIPAFDASTAPAWELGAHLGYKFDVSRGRAPTPQFALQFGIAYEHWGAPSVNQSTLSGFSAKAVQNIAFDFGFWFGF
jgi:hypothetical protein